MEIKRIEITATPYKYELIRDGDVILTVNSMDELCGQTL